MTTGVNVTLTARTNRNFARASHFYAYALPSLHDFEVKLPNFTLCEMKDVKTTQRVLKFFLKLDTVLQTLTPEKFVNIWQIERNGIRAKRFKAARIHFLSDVFAAVVVLDTKVPSA